MKRLIDIIVSFCGIVVLFPILAIIWLLITCTGGKAIYSQERIGYKGIPFKIYKFRTMDTKAPPELATCDFANSDEYITKYGAFLRRTGIDELPQLFNILRGDMSFVGYRPVCLTEKKLNEMRGELGVFALRPGITGLAQVSGRNSIYGERKARLDAEYVSRCSAGMDLLCILKTIKTVIAEEEAT